jgi:hypothetical protein
MFSSAPVHIPMRREKKRRRISPIRLMIIVRLLPVFLNPI